ncbi:MAG: exosortase/archaeosortase family protein [Phycisphaeraceae bacterium]|nr:MAG: exosortase/archaeosortase family protein [Phycisphaeraceae bacterium]
MSTGSPAMTVPASTARDRAPRVAIAVVCLLASFAFVFYHFFAKQVRWAFEEPADWGHTLVIPAMAFYLAWIRRDELARVPFVTTWSGLAPILLGVAWYFFCWLGPSAIVHHNLQQVGVGLTVFGLVLLFFGWKAMRYLWAPVAYFIVFGVTISTRLMNTVTEDLQDLAAYGSYLVLRVLQYDVDLAGNTISIFHNGVDHPLNVAEACSGMRMVVAMLALGVFLAFTGLSHVWQRVVVVLMAAPVALFVNILRVVTLGMLSLIDSEFAAGDFHTFIGLLWLIPALLLYLGIMWVLRRLVVEEASQEAGVQPRTEAARTPFAFDRRAALATMVACGALVVSGLGFRGIVSGLKVYLLKKPVPLRHKLATIPSRSLGRWEKVGEDRLLDQAVIQTLGTSEYLSRVYARTDDKTAALYVHMTYYTDQIDAIPHVPDRCFLASGRNQIDRPRHLPVEIDRSGWVTDDGPPNRRHEVPYRLATAVDRITARPFEVRMPIEPEPLAIRVLEFQEGADARSRVIAGYFFIANGAVTPQAERVRALAFDRTDEYAYYAKVEFSMAWQGEGGVDEFMRRVNDILQPLLPEIMRCLPDWSEVERGLYPAEKERAIPPLPTFGEL